MDRYGFTNSDIRAPETGIESVIGLPTVLLSNDNRNQNARIEELRDAYRAGISSGPSIEITVDELLIRFKADLNVQTKI